MRYVRFPGRGTKKGSETHKIAEIGTIAEACFRSQEEYQKSGVYVGSFQVYFVIFDIEKGVNMYTYYYNSI